MVYLGDGLILVITILLFQKIPISSHSKKAFVIFKSVIFRKNSTVLGKQISTALFYHS